MANHSALNRTIYLLIFIALSCWLTLWPAGAQTTGKHVMPTNAQEYVASFRRGEDFVRPASGIIVNGQTDVETLRYLGGELLAGGESVRENIVDLLVDVGLSIDPLTAKGAEVLRHPQIIALLAGPGLSKADLGMDAAIDALRKLVRPADLARYGDEFSRILRESPSEDSFLLVAKAKPQAAASVVEKLANLPQWQAVEAAQIARAAFGKEVVENQFLAAASAAEAAEDGQALSHALGSLALIGTSRSLVAIAERLRTPLTIDIPGAFEKSVRLNVLEALLYNYPDRVEFYPNNIISEADYTAAERLCSDLFGVRYSQAVPPFMTYRGYPIPAF